MHASHAHPAGILCRMARRRRPQSIEQAASALLATLLSTEEPPRAMLEAGHALVEAMAKAGMLKESAATLHAELAARLPRVVKPAASTGQAQAYDDATDKHQDRQAALDGLLACQQLTPQQVREARMLIMGLELSGKLDKSAADEVLRSILDRTQGHRAS